MHVELVRTVTRDGLRLDGALVETRTRWEGALPTAAILLHGVAGNFYTSSTLEAVIPRLGDLGLAVLSVNTRGHDSVFSASLGTVRKRLGSAYEIVDECRLDVAAWIDFLASRGHRRMVLVGHSLGAIKAVYALAQGKSLAVAGVIAASPPRLSHSAFMNAPESSVFFESLSTAQRMAEEGRDEELFAAKFPFPLVIAARAFLDKYGPAERYNILRFTHEVPCATLFVYGSKELAGGGIAFAGLPEALASLPNADRRQVAVIEGADHFYSGMGDELAKCMAGWIERLPAE